MLGAKSKRDQADRTPPQFVIEQVEPRVLFSGNMVSGIMAIVGVLDPKSAQSQPGGYDPKIGLLPWSQR